jgi:hypothetical protein
MIFSGVGELMPGLSRAGLEEAMQKVVGAAEHFSKQAVQ